MTLIISAATWDKELKSGMRQIELIPLALEAGCGGIEVRPFWHNLDEELPALTAALSEHKLACVYASNEALLAATQPDTLKAIASLKEGIKLARRLGSDILRFNVANGPFAISFVHTAWWAEAMQEVVDLAVSLSVTLAVENGPDAQKGNPEVFAELFSALPALGMTFDTANWLYANTQPEVALTQFSGKIRYVHLKDIICENAALKHGHPGSGLVDVKGLLDKIEDSGFTGLMALEFPGGDKPMQRVADSLRYLGK